MPHEKRGVAVVGLGAMGGAVAANLAGRGYDVVGFDLDRAARSRAAESGVRVVDSLAECVVGARYVVSSLPNSEIVKAVWTGPEGVLASASPCTVMIELSSIDPVTMISVAEAARERGLDVLDCPVSGGPREAADGTLTLLVGGEESVLEAARPLLEGIGSTVAHTGPVGTGKTVKIVNNMMSLGNVLVAAEAFTIGVQAGVDPERLLDVLSVSGGRSHHLLKRFPHAIQGDFAPGFKLWLGEKDVGLGIDLAHTLGVPAPAAGLVREIYRMAMADGMRELDIVAVLRLYQQWAIHTPAVPGQEP